ncbi:hypothetical protein UlMin_004962 [Ulmus minor]
MFYSQTFLGRKGPLGTVWCAAHLQHRLRKSHYMSTDIPSTVERIMFPEVPIALRMSGYLLLGVVRIYFKQVDYLQQDCSNFMTRLKNTYPIIELNLPEDARQAPVQAVTIPESLDLDAVNLDDDMHIDRAHDHHLRTYEDITLTDQISFGTSGQYITVSFDEEIFMDSSHPKEVPSSDPTAMDETAVPTAVVDSFDDVPDPSNQIGELNRRDNDDNTLPSSPRYEVPEDAVQDPGISNREKDKSKHSDDNSPEDFQEIEVMREAVPDITLEHLPPISPNHGNDIIQPQGSVDVAMHEKEILSPIIEDNLSFGEQILQPFQPNLGPGASGASLEEGLRINNTLVSFAIRSTPPVQQPPKPKRKRKQYYDEAPVLTNKFMKKALEDPSDIKRKRRKIPCSTLGIWKLQNNLRKEQIFFQPSITGLCSDLGNIYNKDYLSKKVQSLRVASPDAQDLRSPAPARDVMLDPGAPQSPPGATEVSPEHRGASDEFQEIERVRDAASHEEGNILPEFIPSPIVTPSHERYDLSHAPSTNLGSTSVPMVETTAGTGGFSTSGLPSSTGLRDSEVGTPATYMDEPLDFQNTGLSDIPEFNHEEDEELFFLEADNNTPTGSQGTQGIDSLSVRTRAVAQYLKRQSPITPISEGTSGDLSLNKILEGKRRNLCARMFFETLVLKSHGLVDVEQEEPYGNINLKLTPALSKAQI